MSAVASPLLPVYPPTTVTFVEGDGTRLFDAEGRSYLDFCAGIAVVALGHRHPAPLAAAEEQLGKLWHCSNLFGTEPAPELATKLSERFGGAQTFFCNSGAEAVEAAIKYARKATGKTKIVALEGSFHGRTTGALAATGQPAKRSAFEPLLPAAFVRPNDTAALTAAIDGDTALVILEPVLGEGGVVPLEADFVAAAFGRGALVCLDEIQTGVGRTGTFFCFEQLGVKPDLVTMAKGLANGLPIGALLVADEAAGAFAPGDHGSTFGGNPVACAAACAVLDTVDDALMQDVTRLSDKLQLGLSGLGSVRGKGLLLGVELDRPVPVQELLAAGLVVSTATPSVLRLTPPLTVTDAEVDEALAILHEVLA